MKQEKRTLPTSSRDETLRGTTAAAFLAVDGMSTPSCGWRVRNRLLSVPGVYKVELVLARNCVRVTYDPASVTPMTLTAILASGPDGCASRVLLVNRPNETEGSDGLSS